MTKFVYATKNKLSGNFNEPKFYDFEKDGAVEQFTISALENPSEILKELEVYFLGTFDTKTGIFVSEVEYLIDLGAVLNGRQEQES